jgi:YesN/AraC family two-component response regulator
VPLLITDYNMPRMNGLELIGNVMAASPSTRVALITAYASTELERRARAIGVDYYLPKPFPLERIEQVVHQTLPPPERMGLC